MPAREAAGHAEAGKTARGLVLTRTFNAPRTLVFAAWTDPKRVAQWWGPHGFTAPVCEVDARPGGAIRIHMRGPDGVVYPMTGTYREVTPPERLVFTSAALDQAGKPLFEILTTVTLTEQGGKTTLTVRARVVTSTPEAAPYLQGMDAGWTQTLERLEAHVAQGRAHPSGVQSGYAPVNGLKMYYEIHGSAKAGSPPLLLLHGGGSTIDTSFGKVLPALAQTRQVIAVEQQGHGHTADVDRPFTFAQSAEDTVGLLRHLTIRQADVLGYSNGGHIALQIAISHPEVVRKLVIESAMFNREGTDPGFWEGFTAAKPEDLPAELRAAYLNVAPRPGDLPTFFAKSVQRMLHFTGWTPEEIRSIRAPTLVIAGDRDIVRPEHAVLMFRLLPHAWLAMLPGTDHMTIVNRGDWVVSMVEAFLDAPMP